MFGLGSFTLVAQYDKPKEKETKMIKFKKPKDKVTTKHTLTLDNGVNICYTPQDKSVHLTKQGPLHYHSINLNEDEVQELVDFLNKYSSKE